MHKTLPNFLSHIISHIAHYVALLLILILNFSLSKKKKNSRFVRGREGGRKSSMNQGQIIEDLERKTTPKVIP